MNQSFHDLFDCHLIRKCCKCKTVCFENIFHKDKEKNDGLYPQCKNCEKDYRKKFFYEKRDFEHNCQKNYNDENHEKIFARQNEYVENRNSTDDNFQLFHNTSCRNPQALTCNVKSSFTKHLFGIDFEPC